MSIINLYLYIYIELKLGSVYIIAFVILLIAMIYFELLRKVKMNKAV